MTSSEAAGGGMQGLLAAFGRQVGLDDLAFGEDGHCVLAIDGVIVNLECDERRGLLLIYAALGMPDGDLAAVHAALLHANYLGIETNGMTLALRPQDNMLVMSRWLDTRPLDLQDFEAALQAFVDTAEAWTARLPGLGAGVAAASGSPAPGALRA